MSHRDVLIRNDSSYALSHPTLPCRGHLGSGGHGHTLSLVRLLFLVGLGGGRSTYRSAMVGSPGFTTVTSSSSGMLVSCGDRQDTWILFSSSSLSQATSALSSWLRYVLATCPAPYSCLSAPSGFWPWPSRYPTCSGLPLQAFPHPEPDPALAICLYSP